MTPIDGVAAEGEARSSRFSCVVLLWVALLLPAVASAAEAAGNRIVRFDISRQRADKALIEFAEQADVTFIFPVDEARKVTANAVRGEFTPQAAIALLLEGTGLQPRVLADGALTVNAVQDLAGKGETMKKRGLIAGIVAVLAATASADVKADQDADSTKLEEIVVTAQKREENVHDVPMSIVALRGEDLEAQGISDLKGLALRVPGLATWDAGGYGFRQMYMRGVGNIRGTSSIVGVYVDDTSVVGINNAQLDLRIYDLERVEVLRGPQGTLYGDGSMGGTLRFITKDPNPHALGGRAEVSSAFTEGGSPTQTVRGVLNVPLVDNVLGLRVSATYEDKGGWIDQTAIGRKDVNDGELINVRAKTLWQPTEKLKVLGTAIVHRNDAGALDTGEVTPGAPYQQVLGRQTTPSGIHDYDLYSLAINYDFGPVSLLSSTGYIDYFNRYLEFGFRVPLADPALSPSFDIINGIDGDGWDSFLNVVTEELRLTSNGDNRLNWTAGLYYRDAKSRNDQVGNFGGFFPLLIQSTIKSEALTAYGQAAYSLTDRLDVGGGASYFTDRRSEADALTGLQGTKRFHSTNPRVFASYDLTDDVKVYTSAAKGFRSGGFNVISVAVGQPPYGPDSIWSYELGTKMALLNGRLSFETALFYSDYSDVQINFARQAAGGGLIQYAANSGDAEIKGIDFGLNYRLSDQVTLGIAGEYVDTEMVRISNPDSPSHAPGDKLDEIPENHLSAWAAYDFQWFNSRDGYARLDFNHQGKAELINRTVGPWFVSSSDEIDVLDAILGWKGERFSVDLFGQNLLNERGFLTADRIDEVAPRQRPRTFGVKLMVNFE